MNRLLYPLITISLILSSCFTSLNNPSLLKQNKTYKEELKDIVLNVDWGRHDEQQLFHVEARNSICDDDNSPKLLALAGTIKETFWQRTDSIIFRLIHQPCAAPLYFEKICLEKPDDSLSSKDDNFRPKVIFHVDLSESIKSEATKLKYPCEIPKDFRMRKGNYGDIILCIDGICQEMLCHDNKIRSTPQICRFNIN